jgi:hypothetical protein
MLAAFQWMASSHRVDIDHDLGDQCPCRWRFSACFAAPSMLHAAERSSANRRPGEVGMDVVSTGRPHSIEPPPATLDTLREVSHL